jgi:hypothetical protein
MLLFSPTIGAAITGGYWFLRVRCPACRTTGDADLRTLDRYPNAAVTALIPAVVPILPAECTVCRASAVVATERHRRMECGAGKSGAGRIVRAPANGAL